MTSPSQRSMRLLVTIWVLAGLAVLLTATLIWWNFLKPANQATDQARQEAAVVASQAQTFQSAIATVASAVCKSGDPEDVDCVALSSLATQEIIPSVQPGAPQIAGSTVFLPTVVPVTERVVSYTTVTGAASTDTVTNIYVTEVPVTASGVTTLQTVEVTVAVPTTAFETIVIGATQFIPADTATVTNTERETFFATRTRVVPTQLISTETVEMPVTVTATLTETQTETVTSTSRFPGPGQVTTETVTPPPVTKTETETETVIETETRTETETATETETETVTETPVTETVTITVTVPPGPPSP